MDPNKGKEKNNVTPKSTSPKEDEAKSSQNDVRRDAPIVTSKGQSETPSMEDVKAHIRANFPDFDVSALFESENEKKVSFAKGVTPARTPTSYYRSNTPHSYSKGFTPQR